MFVVKERRTLQPRVKMIFFTLGRSVSLLFVASLLALSSGCGNDGPASSEKPALASNIPDTMEDVHDGRTLFELHCIACHGAGAGYPGTMRLQERVGEQQAALLDRDNLPPDYIKLVVREGFKLMPPFRPSELSDEQLHELAAYIAGEVD